ncbi:MAG: hypothetical protein KDE56_19305, partial [Anaerolineales bacterium]|nr:hypothetical protein [Anaerolineales bacterium]
MTENETTPQVIHLKSEGNNRTPLWVLAGVALGFLLPVCSCIFFVVAAASLGTAGLGSTTADVGTGDAV